MTNTQTVLLVGGGLIAYTMFTKKAALGSLNFYPASIKNIHFDGSTPVMTIGLAVQNTSNQKFILRSMAGNLYANSYMVGNLSFFQEQQILPNSQGTLWVDIRMSLIGAVQDIIRDFQNNNFSQELHLDAYANIDNYQVPIDLKYKVGI